MSAWFVVLWAVLWFAAGALVATDHVVRTQHSGPKSPEPNVTTNH